MRRRLVALLVGLAVLASACGGADTEGVSASDDSATTPDQPDPEPQAPTPTTGNRPDAAALEAGYEDLVARTDPLPPDGGELVPCADVPELESRVEGKLSGRQNIPDDVAGALLTYWMEHAETFGGMWIDRGNGGTIVLAFTDDPQAHREAILARAPSPDDVPATIPPPPITDERALGERDDVAIDVVPVDFTEAQLRATQQHLGELLGAELGLLGSGIDTTKNRITLDLVDPPEGALDTIASLVPAAAVCITVTTSPHPPQGPLDVIPDLDVEDPLVSCRGTPPMPYSKLVAPDPIDDVEHPAVDALRAELATPGVEPLPEGDWVVLSIDDDLAVFAALGEDSFGTASVERQGDVWVLSGWSSGGACDPVVSLPDGLGQVDVRLDPDSLPGPDDTVIDLLVTEVDCASGREMGDALVGPQIVETEDAVLVAFAVIPVVGGANCQSNPSTSVSIELSEPLGDRLLLDGIRVPPRPLTDEADL